MNSLERLRIRLNGEEVEDNVLLDLLESAKNIILTYRYPCGNFPTVKQNPVWKLVWSPDITIYRCE